MLHIRADELRFSLYVVTLTRPPEDSEKKLEMPTNLEILPDVLNIFYNNKKRTVWEHPDVQKNRLWHARINSSPVLAWVSDRTGWDVNVCQSM